MPKKGIKLSDKEICEKWISNKTINPETLRKIKENGPVYKSLANKCLKDIKQSSRNSFETAYLSFNSSSKKSFKTAKSHTETNSENKKINAYKKIRKLFIPYIKRTSVNIIDRVNYYILIKQYLLKIKDTKNCLRLYNFDNKTNLPIYRVGKDIILDKKIGSDSAFGIVFLGHFKSNVKLGTKFDKLNKFAVKITNQTRDNKNEIIILNKLTKLVIDFKCPHFPISYGSLRCNNSRAKSDNPDDYSIVNDKHKKVKLFPKLINKNKSLLIQINELATGDLDSIIESKLNYDFLNTITQVFISIMFFQHYSKYYHNDAHAGNFLYHKIKPGGYFHYNIYGIDYYLENKGYLWVIWDFGLIEPIANNKLDICNDFEFILDKLDYYDNIIKAEETNFLTNLYSDVVSNYDNIKDLDKVQNLYKDILDYFVNNVSSFTTIKPSNIINNKPYIIAGNKKPETPITDKKSYFTGILDFFLKK
jgi:hypothetical protein